MRDTATSWADYIAAVLKRTGMSGPALAEAIGVKRPTVYRWQTGQAAPRTPAIAAAVAVATGGSISEALAAGGLAVEGEHYYGGSEATVLVDTIPATHPLARELGALLDPNSPLADDDRNRIESLVDAILQPYRRVLGSAAPRKRSA